MTLWQIIRDAAERFPNRVAVTSAGRDFTYAELDDRVERLAAAFQTQGLRPGDRVLTALGNTIENLLVLLGCFRVGLLAVPLFSSSIPAQIRHAIRQSGARGIIAPMETLKSVFCSSEDPRPDVVIAVGDSDPPPGMIPWRVVESCPGGAPPPPDANVDHMAVIVFTSGTTSRPKAVVHSQNRMARRAETFAKVLELTRDDVAFVQVDFVRPVALLGQIISTFLVGGRVILFNSVGPSAFWAEYSAGPPKTVLFTNPGTLAKLMNAPAAGTADHTHLRLWLSGGDTVPAALHTRFRAITGHSLIEVFGMTEAGVFALNRQTGPEWTGCIGKPLPGVEYRIVGLDGKDCPPGAIGEIHLRSPDMMVGFWNDTSETFRVMPEGWLHTGDLAQTDGEGRLWFVGRCKDQINLGGPKVAPAMVEAALASHPAVEQAVVVGAPAEVGQVPFAFLTLCPGAICPPEVDLRLWLADRLDAQSIPDRFVVLEDWPQTYHGKLDRDRLRLIAANDGVVV